MPTKRFDLIRVSQSNPDLHAGIQIALANLPVLDVRIEGSYLGEPDLSRKRWKELSALLNLVSRYRDSKRSRIDLLIFPEVSIPHSWAGFLVQWARTHNIGVVCGLEHRVNSSNEALNEVLAALPYKNRNGRPACMPIKRLKRWYSPHEEFLLTNHGFRTPTRRDPYQLIQWRGASFAIYNCFELANINDRALFKAKVDFIVCTEFNHDVNYFSNIVESASRDLHCYVIQVNASQFGDSRVVNPSKTEMMSPLRIKGGDNITFLTTRLDLKALRDHQRKGYGLQKDSKVFKPTPPEMNLNDITARIRLGRQTGR